MGDFMQAGGVATVHRLPGVDIAALEKDLERFSGDRPLALVIPALASEMYGPALGGILEQLEGATYLSEVILVLGRADRKDYSRAQWLMENQSSAATVIWPEGPELAGLFSDLGQALDIGMPGKGRDVWIALGYVLGRGGIHSLALHDADIVSYTREIPLRLLLPLVHTDLNYSFCKGYYPRISQGSLAGRVTRLLVWPLVDVLGAEAQAGILKIIGSMRYPLAGEFALTCELGARVPVPRDWGLEVGLLAAVTRTVSPNDMCQAALCDNYSHKHQELSPDDSSRGLNRMAVEVAESLLRETEPSGGWREDIPHSYVERALEMIPLYRGDALANGLTYDEASEKKAVHTFSRAVEIALSRLTGEQALPPLASWEEIEGRIPGLMSGVVEAVRREES